MTNEILETDIEIARSMLRKGARADEVSGVLIRRGLEPNRAAQLVSDLQQGKQVQVDLPFRPARRHSPHGPASPGQSPDLPEISPRGPSSSYRERGRSKKHPSPFSPANPLFSVGVAIAGIVLISVVVLYNRHARKQMMQFDAPAEPVKDVATGKAQNTSGAAPVVFELDK